MDKKVKKKVKPKTLATWALALIAFGAASFVGVFALMMSIRDLPAAKLPAGAPAASVSPAASRSADAPKPVQPSLAPTQDMIIVTKPAATPSPSPLPSQTIVKKPTPPPSQAAAATPKPTASARPDAKSPKGPVKVTARTMTIDALLGRLSDRPLDATGAIGIVKRSGVSYYVWAQDLYLYDGKSTVRILQNVSCGWMYEDERQDLWFSIRGGSGIDSSQVRDWDHVYRYDRARKAFALMKSEGLDCSFADEYGIVMAGPCFFYVESGFLMAFDTQTGIAKRVGAVCPDTVIRPAAGADAIYYQNGSRQYVLLSHPGKSNQSSAVLDLMKFPGGKFACTPYVLDDDFTLYENSLTGYGTVCRLKDVPAGAGPDGGARIVPVSGGFAIPGGEAAYVDVFDLASRAWKRIGNPARECFYCDAGADGRFWFVDWKPAALISAGMGGYEEYDLSGALTGCSWAGMADGVLFLSENDLYSNFTHVFLPERKELYEVMRPPLPGEATGR